MRRRVRQSDSIHPVTRSLFTAPAPADVFCLLAWALPPVVIPPTTGSASTAITLVNSPAILGGTLASQAVILDGAGSARLTGYALDTVVDF